MDRLSALHLSRRPRRCRCHGEGVHVVKAFDVLGAEHMAVPPLAVAGGRGRRVVLVAHQGPEG